MENIFINIISILIQTVICTYFLTSFCKFINNANYTKKQILIHSIFILSSTIIRYFNKKHNTFFKYFVNMDNYFYRFKILVENPYFKMPFNNIIALYFINYNRINSFFYM